MEVPPLSTSRHVASVQCYTALACLLGCARHASPLACPALPTGDYQVLLQAAPVYCVQVVAAVCLLNCLHWGVARLSVPQQDLAAQQQPQQHL